MAVQATTVTGEGRALPLLHLMETSDWCIVGILKQNSAPCSRKQPIILHEFKYFETL